MLDARVDLMPQSWTTVFTGPLSEVAVVRAKLEARGIPVFLPGETMRGIGLMGDYGVELALEPNLQVPSSALEEARTLIAERDEDLPIRADEELLPQDFFEADAAPVTDPAVAKKVATLSRCIVWGALFPLGAPFSLWYLRPYLQATKLLDPKPPMYKATIAAGCVAAFHVLGAFLWIWMGTR